MAITFPNSPTTGDEHDAENGIKYIWDGYKWTTEGSSNIDEDGYIESNGTTVTTASIPFAQGLTSAGRVGIGTSSPDRNLEIAGSGGANNVELRLNATDGGQRQITFIGAGSNTFVIRSPGATDNSLMFLQGSTERLRINSDGNVGIGNSDPDAILTLGDFGGSTQLIRMRTGTAQVAGIDFGDDNDADAGRVRYHNNGDYFGFFTSRVQRIRVDSDGLKFGTDTATANALDDYEEGTWTATISSGITNPVLERSNGNYTKIGRMVFYNFEVKVTSGTPNSDAFMIGGLPFTSAAQAQNFNNAVIIYNNVLTGFSELRAGHISTNRNKIQFYNGVGSINGNSPGLVWIAGRRFIVSGSYMV